MNQEKPEVVVVGSYVQDLAFMTEKFPSPGETRIGTFQTGQGGKGFNQAVACNRQEIPTTFIGAIGQDAFGKEVQEFASKEKNLHCNFYVDSNHPSGAASIVVNSKGQNLITVALGANEYLPSEYIKSLEGQISHSKVLLCQLENNLEATKTALEIARKYSVQTILNPAPINESLTQDLLSNVQILTPNETEFLYLLNRLNLTDSQTPNTPQGLIRLLQEDKPYLNDLCQRVQIPNMIITLGENGSFISNKDSFYQVLPRKVNTIDTTGAGDAFSGGLAAGLAKGYDLRGAVEYATKVAALSTTKKGTAPAMPYAKYVEKL